MNLGIIGCGLMGKQRARAAQSLSNAQLISVFDANAALAAEVAGQYGCVADASVDELVSRADIDAVVVAVPHYLSRDISIAALEAGKHVMCEKPLGLTSAECEDIIRAKKPNQVLSVGFNYRFYPGVRQTMRMIAQGSIGTFTHMRCILGHGGRPGMQSEWKTKKAQCGGGALLDPGIHFLDLVRQCGGALALNGASLSRTFWEVDVEDNAFLLLTAGDAVEAQVHISLTEWKSRFSIDFFGTDGCLRLRGRSGFYGPQVLRYNRRWEWLQPDFKETRDEYPLEDVSFAEEMKAFIATIEGRSSVEPIGAPEDCLHLLRLIEQVYAETPIRNANAMMAAAQ